jgi:hypothetical protein
MMLDKPVVKPVIAPLGIIYLEYTRLRQLAVL